DLARAADAGKSLTQLGRCSFATKVGDLASAGVDSAGLIDSRRGRPMHVAGRLAAALIAILAHSSLAVGKEWKEIKIGTDATYPPFESLDSSGKFVGFDIDIMDAICAEVKLKCTYINQDFDGIIPALVAGKFDLIDSSISITEERKKTIAFTDKYYNIPPAIWALNDT